MSLVSGAHSDNATLHGPKVLLWGGSSVPSCSTMSTNRPARVSEGGMGEMEAKGKMVATLPLHG